MHGRLPLMLALGCLLLAGCLGPGPAEPAGVAEGGEGAEEEAAPRQGQPTPGKGGPAATGFPVVLAEGTEPFHEEGPVGSYEMAFQVTGFCHNTQEVMAWMFHLSQRLDAAPVPEGATALEATVTWQAEDYAGESLRLVARPPDSDEYSFLADLASGEPATVPVAPTQWEVEGNGAWDFWLCTRQATPDVDPRLRPSAPFVGDVQVLLRALG